MRPIHPTSIVLWKQFRLAPPRTRKLIAPLLALALLGCIGAADPNSLWPRREAIATFAPEQLTGVDLPEFYTPIERARAMNFAGRYRAALIEVFPLDQKLPDLKLLDIALVRAEALSQLGQDKLASDILEPFRGLNQSDDRAAILLARNHLAFGRAKEAAALLADRATQSSPVELIYLLGQSLEAAGKPAEARQAYQQIVRGPLVAKWMKQKAAGFESAAELTFAACAIDRWAVLGGAYREQPELNDQVYDMLTAAYDVIERAYWPARLQAARFAAARDGEQKAMQELAGVLSINPSSVETLVELGTISIRYFQFETADKAIADLRKLNRNSFEANILEARNLLRQRQPKLARDVLLSAEKARPDDAQVLGLLASLDALELNDASLLARMAKARELRPDDARPMFEVAEQLGSMRQYDRARTYYEEAIKRAPWSTAARNGLGLLLTQSGDDDAARTTLEAARLLDPYNRETTNYLRLLDDLKSYTRLEGKHFIIAFDKEADPVAAQFMLDYLDEIHPAVSAKYEWSPEQKTVIELFPTHDRFSVRTTGSPWIGTVGAATGPIIALVSPRQNAQTLGLYNWSQVLKHEYTHTITLGATENRIPHWMTEGLAVLEEEQPLRFEWTAMLYNATTKGTLFDLNQLTWAFVRPKKPSDRAMAYAQSGWLCRYLTDTYGQKTILLMLADFRDGKSQDDVFPLRTGRSLDQLFSDFKIWAGVQTSTWGYDKESSEKYQLLAKEADAFVRDKQFKEAADAWEKASAIRPLEPMPHQRLAGLYLTKELNNPERALTHLGVLAKDQTKDTRIARRAARVARDELKDLDLAAEFANRAVHIDPYSIDAHQLAMDIANAAGKTDLAKKHEIAIEQIRKMKP